MTGNKNKKSISKSDIQTYYFDQKLSAKETGLKLGFSEWQIYKFMKKHKISPRKNFETRNHQFSKSPKSYLKVNRLNNSNEKLMLAGLILYWAEGKKRGKGTVEFTNSDPRAVKIFLKTLRNVYNINESRLRFSLYCFSNQEYSKLQDYWTNYLNINPKQFTKPYIKSATNPQKEGYMPYGVMHLRYNDTRLLTEIKSDIDIISGQI